MKPLRLMGDRGATWSFEQIQGHALEAVGVEPAKGNVTSTCTTIIQSMRIS